MHNPKPKLPITKLHEELEKATNQKLIFNVTFFNRTFPQSIIRFDLLNPISIAQAETLENYIATTYEDILRVYVSVYAVEISINKPLKKYL
jgi:hypothetical protein